MWEYIVWLLFGRDVSLSPEAMTVAPQCVVITPKKAIDVKASNAELVVELPYLPRGDWPGDVISRLDQIDHKYPPGRITGALYRENGTFVEIEKKQGGAAGESVYQLFLAPANGFSKGDTFVRLRLCANPAIKNARLFWRRVGK